MCGICGICNSKNGEKDISIMMESLRHRGPDAAGIYYDKEHKVVLGHRRLSILDLSEAGNQPMRSADGKKIICLNGEVYNYKEIRETLPIEVLKELRSTSDTEVLLEAIAYFGIEETLNRIRGMFALAILDLTDGTITLARDRAGEKPLYYGFIDGRFIFASELKAIQNIGEKYNHKFSLNYKAIGMFLQHSYIPAPNTIYQEINKMESGELLEIKLPYKDISEKRKYWVLDTTVNQINFLDGKRELKKLLESAISEQMIADVPYGAFLSGGIDSSLIVSYMQKTLSKPVKTFSIGFENREYNEAEYAKVVAAYIGTDHREMYISEREVMSVIPEIGRIYDEPFADSSQIPTFFVSQFAKTEVTVAITGDAGDELFCGYEHYIKYNNLYKKINCIPAAVRQMIGKGISAEWIRTINDRTKNNRFIKLSKILCCKNESDFFYQMKRADTSRNGILKSDNDKFYFELIESELNNDVISNMQYIDFMTYLPNDILVKVDRAAMKNSLETRVPFLDKRIIEFAFSLPLSFKYDEHTTKKIIRDLLYDEVPREIVERPKQGFGIPLDEWLRGGLKNWAGDLIFSEELKKLPGIDYKMIIDLWDKEISGHYRYKTIIWNILMLAQWLIDNKGNYSYI
jgi:asparagine synthase (glutamine-hydrolyzing)